MRMRASLLAAALPVVLAMAGCHSYQIETRVENRTGSAIQLLEVDYPSASFGADSVAADADYHSRIQLRGEGPIKVQYTGADRKQVQLEGPMVHEKQEGSLEIVLLPGGKAEFHPKLTPQL